MVRRSRLGEAMRRCGGFAGGFTYIGLLVAVFIIGLLLTMASRVWSVTVQREREAQLLWVGHAYRHAIASYYRRGGVYPQSLRQLVQDDRSPVALHYLRQLYPDPMTGAADWTLIPSLDGQRIMGIASRSKGVPIKRTGFELIDAVFANTDCYCSWQFVYYARRHGVPVAPGGVVPPPTLTDQGPLQPGNGMLTPGTTAPVPASGPN